MDEDEVREKIRLFLKEYFPEPDKRGDANKRYNLSEVEDIAKSVSYLLKDGDYIAGDGIDPDALMYYKKKSFKKFRAQDFNAALEDIKNKFKGNDKLLKRDMMIEIVKLKAQYRQVINLRYIDQLCTSFWVRNDLSRAERVVDEYLNF